MEMSNVWVHVLQLKLTLLSIATSLAYLKGDFNLEVNFQIIIFELMMTGLIPTPPPPQKKKNKNKNKKQTKKKNKQTNKQTKNWYLGDRQFYFLNKGISK